MRAQPYKIELLKSGLMALCGLLLALQPWVGLLRGVGWVLLLAGGILFLALLLKVSAAQRVLREPLASFACGAVVCRRGVLFEGQVYNFSTFGTDVTGLDLLEDRLVFAFSFVAKGKTRGRDVLAIPFEPEELEKARAVVEAYGLPPIDPVAEDQAEDQAEEEAEALPAGDPSAQDGAAPEK